MDENEWLAGLFRRVWCVSMNLAVRFVGYKWRPMLALRDMRMSS